MSTSTIAHEVVKRRDPKIPPPTSFGDDLLRELADLDRRSNVVRFPNPKYQHDPIGFFREVLGLEPWAKQIEILEAVRDNRRVAVCSGHKVGKSTSVAGLALWFYCSFPDARAIMSSTTSRQVDQILWRELRMLRARSGRCVRCKAEDPEGFVIPRPCPHSALIDGEAGELARTGLKSEDFREVVGFTAREAEAVAGISGRNLLYLVDEASGVSEDIFHGIEGNRAGGARIVLIGNPTRNEGEFFEAFHGKAHLYKTLRISSEESPNVTARRIVIPGLASADWIEEKRIEWGEDSPLYRVRVKGEHAIHEQGKIFSLYAIAEAEKRWHDTPETGRLFVGIDPAGESGTGDETVFCVRRGLKQLMLQAHTGLTAEGHLTHLLHLLRLRLPRETPVVVLDVEGSIGSRLARVLRSYLEEHTQAFELVTLKISKAAIRQPQVYDRLRDELAANLEQWLRDGGALLEDARLERELHTLEWRQAVNGKLKITPKDTIRKLLGGRSPDRYDATSFAVWEPLSLRDTALPSSAAPIAQAEQSSAYDGAGVFDPYAGSEFWQGGKP